MVVASLIITVVGLAVTLGAATWLLLGIRHTDARFTDDGPLVPGDQKSTVVPALIKAQRGPTVLTIVGGGIQVLGGALAIAAALQSG